MSLEKQNVAGHGHNTAVATEQTRFGAKARSLMGLFAVIGLAGIVVSFLLAFAVKGGIGRVYFAYLTAYVSFLAIALGALFFVLVNHVVAAGWSVSIRRVAETMSVTLPLLGVLSLPILVSVLSQKGDLYRWALPMSGAAVEEHHPAAGAHGDAGAAGEASAAEAPADAHGAKVLDEMTLKKRAWLNPGFFAARIIIYFVIWSAMALHFWRKSVQQDESGDPEITRKLRLKAAPMLVIYGVSLTFASFDLMMSLDPHWYSTIFGVFYFAGCVVSALAALIVVVTLLQKAGLLRGSINTEHYHDMGKYLFGFVFFWGYIAFSQYMLLWYASLPETVPWFARRGATTALKDISQWGYVVNGWTWLAVAILFGFLLIPFAGLLSRHVKRFRPGLVFWAVWLLAFHYLNHYWLVMPEWAPFAPRTFSPSIVDLTTLLGVGGVCVAGWIWVANRAALRPLADPRLPEALAFQNI